MYFTFIKYLTKGTMIHILFNNIFTEENTNKENFKFPINEDNDILLLYLIDLYNKCQYIFSLGKDNNSEFVDIVNYIEMNLSKADVLCNLNS